MDKVASSIDGELIDMGSSDGAFNSSTRETVVPQLMSGSAW
ncbi:MAG: hypothetical protein U1F52_01625 [Burkholderiales bacterium]